jgi:oligopeptide transport system substrate-binding protein
VTRLLLPIALILAVLVAVVAVDRTPKKADLVFAGRGDVFTLDPQRMSWLHDMRMAYCLYEGLVRWNTDDYSIEPAAAVPHVSDDGMVYTFSIREDAKWSNGAPVTANDFRYAWMRMLTPDTAADYSGFFFAIRGARDFWDWRTDRLAARDVASAATIERRFNEMVSVIVEDDHTLRIELEKPVPYFLDQLALAVCSPVYRPSVEGWQVDDATEKIIREHGWHTVEPPPMERRRWVSVDDQSGRLQQQQFWARPGRLIGNGPYILDTWRYKRDMRLERNPLYHSPQEVHAESIQGVTMEDTNTAVMAFESGNVDWLTDVNVSYQADMLAQREAYEQRYAKEIDAAVHGGATLDQAVASLPPPEDGERRNIRAFPTFGTDFFSFNCRPALPDGQPNPFHDPAVRRAFVMAVDRGPIVAHATRLNEPTVSSLIPPGSISGYPTVDGLGHDADAARRELAAAGWEDQDGDGVPEDVVGRPFPSVDLLYTTNTARYKWIALELRNQWQRELGVRVELRGTDNKFYSKDLHNGNFMVARGRWYGDYGDPTTFLDIFRSKDGNNDRGYANPEVDRALDAAALEQDPAKRLAMLHDVEEFLFTEEVPMLVICQLLQVYMYEPDEVHGISPHPRMVQYLWQIE